MAPYWGYFSYAESAPAQAEGSRRAEKRVKYEEDSDDSDDGGEERNNDYLRATSTDFDISKFRPSTITINLNFK